MRTSWLLIPIFALITSSALGQATDAANAELREAIAAGKQDEILGHYHAGFATVIHVTREGKQIFAQTGESSPFLELHPKAPGEFTAMNDRANIRFTKDAAGNVTTLTLRQGTNEQTANRITTEAAAKIKADLEKRIAENRPMPGTEAILREHIEAMRAEKPIYDKMTSGVASAVKAQAEMSRARLAQVGAIRAIEFTGIAPNGLDMYRVQYENGTSNYLIGLDTDGKIAALGVQMAQ